MNRFLLYLNDTAVKYRGKCVYCLRELPAGKFVCEKCGREEARLLRHSFHGKTLYTAEYDGIVRSMLRRYKYSGHPSFSVYIAKLMSETLKKIPVDFDIVTYVPIHEKRLGKRGFDQSELICHYLTGMTGAKGMALLRRIKNTEPFYNLSKAEREAEIKNAFEYAGGDIAGRTVLLLDDISTTGTSMVECERVLEKHGARVIRFAFAKGAR